MGHSQEWPFGLSNLVLAIEHHLPKTSLEEEMIYILPSLEFCLLIKERKFTFDSLFPTILAMQQNLIWK